MKIRQVKVMTYRATLEEEEIYALIEDAIRAKMNVPPNAQMVVDIEIRQGIIQGATIEWIVTDEDSSTECELP